MDNYVPSVGGIAVGATTGTAVAATGLFEAGSTQIAVVVLAALIAWTLVYLVYRKRHRSAK